MNLTTPRVEAAQKPVFKTGIPKSGFGAQIRVGIREAFGDQYNVYTMRRMIFDAPPKFDEQIYGNNFVWHAADHFEKLSPNPFCTADVRFILTGTLLVMGFLMPELKTLLEYAKELGSMNATSLAAVIESGHNVAMVLKPGYIATLPSGYLYMTYSPVNTAFVRFGYSPTLDGEDLRVKTSCESLLEAMPQYKESIYALWLEILSKP